MITGIARRRSRRAARSFLRRLRAVDVALEGAVDAAVGVAVDVVVRGINGILEVNPAPCTPGEKT
jgi:hypothetical protein